jgi:ankyrin repeat protein
VLRNIANILKSILFPLSSCDQGALLNAAATGELQELKELLVRVNPNFRLNDGTTLLINVAISQYLKEPARIKVFEILKQAGASVDLADRRGITPLMYATGLGETAFCAILIESGASLSKADQLGDNALIWAASTGKLASIKFMISNVNHAGNLKRTALMYAARNGNLEHVKELIDSGADIRIKDAQGYHALLLACLAGKAEVARYLANLVPELCKDLTLAAAASVGFCEHISRLIGDKAQLVGKNENGFTPLELAVIFNQSEAVIMLLPYYAEQIQLKSLALGSAVLGKSIQLMQLILDSGVNINYADEIGETALMHAVRLDFAQGAQLLFNYGANKNIKNNAGDDAQDIAQAVKSYEALQVIFKN